MEELLDRVNASNLKRKIEEERYDSEDDFEYINEYSKILTVDHDAVTNEPITKAKFKGRSVAELKKRMAKLRGTGSNDPRQEALELTPTDMYFMLDKEWKDVVKRWQTLLLECARCGTLYKEIDNIGTWKCHQHSLGWNYQGKGTFREKSQWDCCGEKMKHNLPGDPRGCVRGDHSPDDVVYSRKDDIVLPNVVLNFIVTQPKSTIRDKNERILENYYPTDEEFDDNVIVRRFDWKEDESRRYYGGLQFGKSSNYGEGVEEKFVSQFYI